MSSSSSLISDPGEGPSTGPSTGRGRGRRGRGGQQVPARGRGRRGRDGQQVTAGGRGRRGRGGQEVTRGRGRSGRRGGGRTFDLTGIESADSRAERLRTYVNEASPDRLRNLALKMIDAQPGIMLNLIDEPTESQPGGHHPPPGSNTPGWCVCGHCREMPTAVERVCCGKRTHCLSRMPEMATITDTFVLHLSRKQRQDILVFDEEDSEAKANRHAAYRQFVFWQHGRLGVGNRKIIPSCCVWNIRDKYPDPFQQYRGFQASRLS